MQSFTFDPIGYVQSPFKDKFGVPRQPGLASEAKGILKFSSDPDIKTALKQISEFSHIWIVFVFHDRGGNKWKPSVRPPRLGGNVKVGVLSSRSPHRPNPIGISAVQLTKVDLDAKGGPELFVSGLDLIDGTPILDIKPYIPYADSIPEANAGWASEDIKRYPVTFSVEAEKDLVSIPSEIQQKLRDLTFQVLELDPRPAFKKRQFPADDPKTWGQNYGIAVLDYDVKYTITEAGFIVSKVIKL